jgi:basic membrane lipoprotein Med (substrate-binding protein (PBP1-ABC) superfamily)
MDEIEQTLTKCNSISPGSDNISYSFIQNSGTSTKQHLLNIYNHIWKNEQIPIGWKTGNIILILKSGKDKHSPERYRYRPIILLNAMAKIHEKIVNPCLIWFLEKNKNT